MELFQADPKMFVYFDQHSGFVYEHTGKVKKELAIKNLYAVLAHNGELDYEANLAIAVLNGDRVAARALADKVIEEATL